MTDIAQIADEAFTAMISGRQITPFTSRPGGFTQQSAYGVTPLLRRAYEAQGDTVVGRKIGFTNRRIWPEYGVDSPNWGYVTDRTVHDLATTPSLPAGRFIEPKIEPEIMFGLAAAPKVGMDEFTLLGCVEWVAFGYEIVQSIYPGWKFAAADTAVANAMHGALLIGARHSIAPRKREWLRELASFTVELSCDGKVMDRGEAANVLDGPLKVLAHMTGMLAKDTFNPPLAADEIISTGTLTRALDVKAGQSWTAQVSGIPLEPISLRFT
jgi:2-oxo-3-hexenedioate decarboxylase